MQGACPVSLNSKSRDRHIAMLMSVSIADLKLPTEGKNSRLNIIPIILLYRRGGR